MRIGLNVIDSNIYKTGIYLPVIVLLNWDLSERRWDAEDAEDAGVARDAFHLFCKKGGAKKLP